MINLKSTTTASENTTTIRSSSSSSLLSDKTTKLNNSSVLLAKLEPINWICSMNTVLNGRPTTILIKYLFDEQEKSYAILLSDFAQTYFECATGIQIEQNYQKYNKIRLESKEIIYPSLQKLMNSMPDSIKNIEKIPVDCHTTRITLRCSRPITTTFCLKWTFHIISTEEDIFLKHLSMPMFRGLMYYYNLSHQQPNQQQQQQQQAIEIDNDDVIMIQESINNGDDIHNHQQQTGATTSNILSTSKTTKIIPIQSDRPFDCIDDNLLNEIFRYD